MSSPDRPESGAPEAETATEAEATVRYGRRRRAPRYGSFLVTGAILGIALGILLSVIQSVRDNDSSQFSLNTVVGYVAATLGLVGALLGAGLAVAAGPPRPPVARPGRGESGDQVEGDPRYPERVTTRGDGRLSHDLLPGEKGPQDACGVFGVWAPGEEVAKLTYFGLYALQHRGQESAGIATSDGRSILVYKDMGLVSQVFDESALSTLRGHLAVGHCRYSTTGGSTWENAQPTLGATAGGTVALAHNGNLTNSVSLRDLVRERYGDKALRDLGTSTTDTSLVTALLAGDPDRSLEATALDVLPELRGAFSLVFMDEHTLYAARDRHGIRPLVLGRLERGWVVASETAALDIVGASVIREVEPGELIAIDADGLRSTRFAAADPKGCVFEYVYLARPDTTIGGRVVHEARVEMGRLLAQQHPVDADLVIPTPESGTPAAIGYAQESGHPLRPGPGQELLRRPDLHRAEPDHPPARHPAQAQPAARGDPRQAADRRRRHHRARQHPARPGPDAA